MAPLSDPSNGRARALLGASVLFLILPPIFVTLRIWARRLKRTPLCFNDYAIMAALLSTSGYNVLSIIGSVKGGGGQHVYTLTSSEVTVYAKISVAATTVWPTANTLVKISVLHFYTKIFNTRMLASSAYAIGAVTLAFWLSTVMTAFLICRPFAFNWDKLMTNGYCGNLSAYYLSTGIVNLLIDVIIVALPLPLLWGLQMKTSRKIALTAIFSLGALICIISIVRIDAINRLNYSDITYSVVLDSICTALEPTLGVINACLPLLQPVVSKCSGSTGPSNPTTSDNDADSFIDDLAQHSGIKVKQRVEIDSAVAPTL
ncbi:hypothetical protein JMJ35_001982 [Cladonia borealis]|uniref:Rhodopsin domain-containing protein n=1 Tax=Cladonia borealis TaxID=184061 RepID=A0AA39R9U2_9LECA|nr:hypothetical protein JMJ35_001982 [Cladonia borealis]